MTSPFPHICGKIGLRLFPDSEKMQRVFLKLFAKIHFSGVAVESFTFIICGLNRGNQKSGQVRRRTWPERAKDGAW